MYVRVFRSVSPVALQHFKIWLRKKSDWISQRHPDRAVPIIRYFCLDTLHPHDLRVDRFHNDSI